MELILDNIRSAYNVGAIIRSASFFGVKKIYLCGLTPGLEHRGVKKTSLGGERGLMIKHVHSIVRLVKKLKTEGYEILALEQDKRARSLWRVKPKQKSNSRNFISCRPIFCNRLLIVGNEVEGVNEKILALVNQIIEIPQIGQKESLNVSVAAGMALGYLTKLR